MGFPVVVWSDFLCPWCYLGTDRSQRLRALGADVTTLPYELHPEFPAGGVPIKPGYFRRIALLCDEVGLEFREPTRLPNSRRLLATAELIRQQIPEAYAGLESKLFAATFVEGRFLGDRDVVDEIVTAAGVDAAEVRDAVDAGIVDQALDASRAAAFERGVTGTPAWLFDGVFLLPGVQDPELYERVLTKLRAAADARQQA